MAVVWSHLGVGLVLLPEPQCKLFDGASKLQVVLLLVPEQERHVDWAGKFSGAGIDVGQRRCCEGL